MHDVRITAHVYANPDRYYTADDGCDFFHLVSLVDYYGEPLKTTYKGLLQNWSGQIPDAEPFTGETAQDIPGTAQGIWFKQGSSSESEGMALVHDTCKKSTGAFSISSIEGVTNKVYYFNESHNGFINRDFSEVTDDGNIYCYEYIGSNTDSSMSTFAANTVIFIQLLDANNLRIEKRAFADAAAQTYTFTAGYTGFER